MRLLEGLQVAFRYAKELQSTSLSLEKNLELLNVKLVNGDIYSIDNDLELEDSLVIAKYMKSYLWTQLGKEKEFLVAFLSSYEGLYR